MVSLLFTCSWDVKLKNKAHSYFYVLKATRLIKKKSQARFLFLHVVHLHIILWVISDQIKKFRFRQCHMPKPAFERVIRCS